MSDYPYGGFEFTRLELKAGIEPPLLSLLFSDAYDTVAQGAADVVEAGRSEAFYAPAVKVIIDSTLSTVTQPGIQERLPREVGLRRNIALNCAEYATGVAILLDAFRRYYGANPRLLGLGICDVDFEELRSQDYLESLGKAPIFDAAVASGGALRALQASSETFTETPAEVIARSSGLLAVSGIYKGHSRRAMNFLGLPYARSEHYVIQDGEKGPEVTFTRNAKAFLASLREEGRGCPAGKIESPTQVGGTLLEEYWGRMVRYLIPQNATVLGTK